MNLRVFSTAAEFLDAAGPTLAAREAENSLMLGVALRLQAGRAYGDEAPFLACVSAGPRLCSIALRTPPYNLLLCAGHASQEPLALLARHLAKVSPALPGAHGTAGVVDAFAEVWVERTGARTRVAMEQRLYRLTEVRRPRDVPGQARWAAVQDIDALAPWGEAFVAEAVPDDPLHDGRAVVERAVAAQGLLLWEDGGPVSMCARSRPTPRGESISLVYTPPPRRGNGYASACVAELSQRILDSGKAFCTLFTDLSNPTSNDIYQRIGYRPLCDFREIRFMAPLAGSAG